MAAIPDHVVCKGCWRLGNNCEKCSKCKETEAAYLREQLGDAAGKAGQFAHWANGRVAELERALALIAYGSVTDASQLVAVAKEALRK